MFKCYYCDRKFKSRCGLSYHLKSQHKNVDIFEYYKNYYNDEYEKYYKHYLPEEIKRRRNELISDPNNYVVCRLCKKPFKQITEYHLKPKHNITSQQYKRMFPNAILYSKNIIDKIQAKRKIKGVSRKTRQQMRKSRINYLATHDYIAPVLLMNEKQKKEWKKLISKSVSETMQTPEVRKKILDAARNADYIKRAEKCYKTKMKKGHIYFVSKGEKEFLDEVQKYVTIEIKRQKHIRLCSGLKILDGYIDTKPFPVVIEFDGNHWHNYPYGLDKDHELDDHCSINKIKIFRFWESDLKDKEFRKKAITEIVKYVLACQYRYESDSFLSAPLSNTDFYQLIECENNVVCEEIENDYA